MVYKKSEKINEILAKIDLTQTQRERAKELYTNICNAIISKSDLNINFYAQGSFATKTVVRPFKNGKNKSYDVDVICEVQDLDKNTAPEKLMQIFENAICSAGYTNYTRWEKCFTIEYAEIDDVGFSIDIIPSVGESIEMINTIRNETEQIDLVESSIAIPNVTSRYSGWISNNPSGYKSWFDIQTQSYERKYVEFRKGKFASAIEELPEETATNMMRNVIKILKRLRDVYFSRAKAQSTVPSSIIITTLVAKLANGLPYSQDEFSLLSSIVTELQQLSGFSKGYPIQKSLDNGFKIAEIISLNSNGQWLLKNPTNGLDNILSSWNEGKHAAEDFFNWISDLSKLIDDLNSTGLESIQKSEILYDSFNLDFSSTKGPDYKVDPNKSNPWRNN